MVGMVAAYPLPIVKQLAQMAVARPPNFSGFWLLDGVGAVALARARKERASLKGQSLRATLTGGNVDAVALADVLRGQ